MNDLGFFDVLTRCRDGTVMLTAFKENGSKEIFRFTDPDEMTNAILRLRQEYKALYIDFNLRRKDLPDGLRGGDDDVIIINAFAGDCDILSPAHKETNLPETADIVMMLLDRYPKPTYLIFSLTAGALYCIFVI